MMATSSSGHLLLFYLYPFISKEFIQKVVQKYIQ